MWEKENWGRGEEGDVGVGGGREVGDGELSRVGCCGGSGTFCRAHFS